MLVVSLLASTLFAGCAESQFELAPDSRLPRWFAIPPGLSRNDVTVTLRYYVRPSRRFATFKLWDSRGHLLAQVSAAQAGSSPHTFGPRTPAGGVDDRSYPLYEIMTVDGTTEVIEHRRFGEPFRITDAQEVKRKLGL